MRVNLMLGGEKLVLTSENAHEKEILNKLDTILAIEGNIKSVIELFTPLENNDS